MKHRSSTPTSARSGAASGSVWAKVQLSLLSAIASVYLCELLVPLLVPLLDPTGLLAKAATDQGKPFDRRPGQQVLAELRAAGIEANLPVLPTQFVRSDGLDSGEERVFPLGMISRSPTVYCNESGDWLVIDTDEQGFNNPVGSWGEPDIEIALIGDSYTIGVCVLPEDNVSGRLQARGWKTLNLGLGGNGPLIELATLAEYASPRKPPVVLWLYFEHNDLLNLEAESQSSLLLRYLEPGHSQGLEARREELDRALRSFQQRRLQKTQSGPDLAARIQGFLTLAEIRTRLASTTDSIPRPNDFFFEVLGAARDLTNSWGGVLYFVYLPEQSRYARTVDEGGYRHRRAVLDGVRELEIPIVDFHDRLAGDSDPGRLFPFRTTAHYTAEGYDLLAETIDQRLQRDAPRSASEQYPTPTLTPEAPPGGRHGD